MANQLENQGIDAAFVDAIAKAYGAMLTGYIEADGKNDKETQADERFKKLVALARKVRQKALGLV